MPERDIHRIIVTGSRAWPDALIPYITEKLALVVSRAIRSDRLVVLVHGDCTLTGQPPETSPVDQVADRFVRRSAYYDGPPNHRYLEVEPHPADWIRHGSGAGPLRNTEMVRAGARQCLAFPDEQAMRGTSDCFTKAIRAGIPTQVYPLSDARRWASQVDFGGAS